MVNMSQTFSSQSGFFGTDDIVKRIFSDTFLDRSHPCRSIFFAIGWHPAMKNKKYTMHSRNWNWKASRCLKITEKVSFNITSEAIYVYILSGQKFIKKWSILASFLKAWRSNSANFDWTKIDENAKMKKFKCDIMSNFQTLCTLKFWILAFAINFCPI